MVEIYQGRDSAHEKLSLTEPIIPESAETDRQNSIKEIIIRHSDPAIVARTSLISVEVIIPQLF